jgi:hypothetical protein
MHGRFPIFLVASNIGFCLQLNCLMLLTHIHSLVSLLFQIPHLHTLICEIRYIELLNYLCMVSHCAVNVVLSFSGNILYGT